MLAKSLSALAFLAFAAHAAAEPMPYKPHVMKMSVRDLFGVVRRQTPGYQPTQAVCGTGNTCEEACGAGFETCASKDSQVHCFNPTVAETCCPDASGNSCDAGFYCTSDKEKETWCCPDSLDLAACAAAFSVTGGLVKQTPKPTSSSASSTAAPITTSSSSAAWSTGAAQTSAETVYTTPLVPSASWPKSNTTSISVVGTSAPTPSKIVEGAGNMAAPAGALVLLAAGLAVLF
ncbi:hypothetical protein B0T25DRAFT_631920 [Lasiosphaeria hispida]|uniref:Prp 4 CRoW domain-containing protein n=1 Tax=Lasiosphaeria hispida TaxID=260671 RepID=A0AAJ0MEH1_9PEZI|nr:hypothetical protein B0T25DRAFT_631920 [Lasiosphaeria hispida]